MPSTLVLGLLLHTVVIPAAAAALLLAATGLRFVGAAARYPGDGVVIAAACLAGYVGVYGWPASPPLQALDWLPLLLLSGMVSYGALDRFGAGRVTRGVLMAVFVAGAAALLLVPLFSYDRKPATIAAAATVTGIWFLTALIHDQPGDGDPSFGVLFFFVAAGNAFIAALTGSVMLGQLSGVLAAVVATWCLWHGMVQRRPLTRAGRGVALTLLAVLLLIGQCYGDTPLWATVMLFALLALHRAVAPLSVCLMRSDALFARLLFTVVLAVAPIATGVYFIVRASVHPGEF